MGVTYSFWAACATSSATKKSNQHVIWRFESWRIQWGDVCDVTNNNEFFIFSLPFLFPLIEIRFVPPQIEVSLPFIFLSIVLLIFFFFSIHYIWFYLTFILGTVLTLLIANFLYNFLNFLFLVLSLTILFLCQIWTLFFHLFFFFSFKSNCFFFFNFVTLC